MTRQHLPTNVSVHPASEEMEKQLVFQLNNLAEKTPHYAIKMQIACKYPHLNLAQIQMHHQNLCADADLAFVVMAALAQK